MSASDTDIEKQVKRHRPTLVGIALAVVAVAIIVLGVSIFGAGSVTDEASSGELKGADAPVVTN